MSKKHKAESIGGGMMVALSGAAKWYTLPGDLAGLLSTLYDVVGSWPAMLLGIGVIIHGLWPRGERIAPTTSLPPIPPLVVESMPNGMTVLPKGSEWMYYNEACKLATPYWIGDTPLDSRKAGELLVAEYAREHPEGFQTQGEAFVHRKSLIAWLQRRQSPRG